MSHPTLIVGNAFEDYRGKVVFSNDFDLSPVRRLYHLIHSDTTIFRAWQGHKVEQKWFSCVQGGFVINYVQPDDWASPSGLELVEKVHLDANHPQVLHLPGGYATGIKAVVPNAILLIFSDVDLEQSKVDDYRFDPATWSFYT